jgi:hypothetical protein
MASGSLAGAVFPRSGIRRAARWLALGAVFGVLAAAVAHLEGGGAGTARAVEGTGVLVAWRVNLLRGLPPWVAIVLSNACGVAVVSCGGLLGCMAEVGLRRRSPVYSRLCRATSGRPSVLRVLDGSIAALPPGAEREGVAIAHLVPALYSAANGAILGLLATVFAMGGVAGVLEFLAAVVPHGVVELPGLLLATAMGFGHADALSAAALAGEDLVALARRRLLGRATGLGVATLAVIFIAAGAMEGLVTPQVLERTQAALGLEAPQSSGRGTADDAPLRDRR